MYREEAPNVGPGELTLVIGVDGSGKSTFLQELHNELDIMPLEPTSNDAARRFKADNLDTAVNAQFIDQREQIFLELNKQFDSSVANVLRQGKNVATSGNGLVTSVSHALMRAVIGEKPEYAVDESVRQWLESDSLRPHKLALVYAPDEIIRQRILQRQQGGDISERFWGFNAPYFLSRYQAAWHQAFNTLAQTTDIPTVTLDSSQLTPHQMLHEYVTATK